MQMTIAVRVSYSIVLRSSNMRYLQRKLTFCRCREFNIELSLPFGELPSLSWAEGRRSRGKGGALSRGLAVDFAPQAASSLQSNKSQGGKEVYISLHKRYLSFLEINCVTLE